MGSFLKNTCSALFSLHSSIMLLAEPAERRPNTAPAGEININGLHRSSCPVTVQHSANMEGGGECEPAPTSGSCLVFAAHDERMRFRSTDEWLRG